MPLPANAIFFCYFVYFSLNNMEAGSVLGSLSPIQLVPPIIHCSLCPVLTRCMLNSSKTVTETFFSSSNINRTILIRWLLLSSFLFVRIKIWTIIATCTRHTIHRNQIWVAFLLKETCKEKCIWINGKPSHISWINTNNTNYVPWNVVENTMNCLSKCAYCRFA